MKHADPAGTREGGLLPPDFASSVAGAVPAINPGQGGRYTRHPETGALTRVQYTETCADCALPPGKKG